MLKYEELPELNSECWLSLEDLKDERWKPVPDFESEFMVSCYGRVKRLPAFYIGKGNGLYPLSEKILMGEINKGYQRVKLKDKRRFQVHVLVASTFLNNHANKPCVDHIDTNRLNNCVDNLKWVTKKENQNNPLTVHHISVTKLGAKNGMYGRCGELSPRSRKVGQYMVNGDFVREFCSVSEANRYYKGHIADCCRGERETAAGYMWKYI